MTPEAAALMERLRADPGALIGDDVLTTGENLRVIAGARDELVAARDAAEAAFRAATADIEAFVTGVQKATGALLLGAAIRVP